MRQPGYAEEILNMKRLSTIKVILFIMLPTVLTTPAFALQANVCHALAQDKNIPASTSQVVMVHSTGGIHAEITACQRTGDQWQTVLTPQIKGVIGTNGVAAIGEKKEGDRKTPWGIYPLGEAFGTQSLALHMDYRYITADDKFVDDATSPQYNTWVVGPTNAKRYESMLIEPYKLGAVINYNMNPVIPGAGSAIFMHIWTSPNTPTAGCVAMDEQSLSGILRWLDKKQHPYIDIDAATNDLSANKQER